MTEKRVHLVFKTHLDIGFTDHDLDADDVRDELQGPLSGEFGLVLVGTDGKVKLRSSEPMSVEDISRAADIPSPNH